MKQLVFTASWLAALLPALAAPVGPALDRPAVHSAQAARAVLLGAALAGTRIVAVGERGIVLWSDDGGARWQQAQVPTSVTLTAVRFADPRTGWATGHGGTVLGTQDGGQSWQRLLDGHAVAKALLADAQTRADAKALANAERMVAEGADKPFLDLHFFDTRRGLVVGAYNLAFSTADGGRSWLPISAALDNPQALHLYTVRARGDTVLLAGEQGLVLKSDDGGRSFRRIAQPYKGSFFTAELPADGAIVLAGLRGNVWRSTDGGVQWAAVGGAGPASITASALLPGGPMLLATQAGTVLALEGAQVALHPVLPGAPATALLALPAGRLLVLGLRGASVHPPSPKTAAP